LSDADSFIEEVTEEVRRDKLFAIFRKYGWLAGLLIVLIVGGAAYNEWRKASERAASEALGDSVMSALAGQTASERAEALGKVSTTDAEAQVFLDLLAAAARAEAENKDDALALLDKIAASPDAPEVYRQLALLKAVILRGADQDRAERLAVLEQLAIPGKPFRVNAMEQIALVHYEFGNNEDAIAVLRTILDEPEATQGLLQRAQQLIVALGGDLSSEESTGEDG